jgi:hypothetical protein
MNFAEKAILKIFASLGYNITNDEMVRFECFENLARTYEILLNNSNYHKIEANDKRPKLLSRLQGTQPSEAYFIIESLAKTKMVPGDVCEFGVAQGFTSALISNEIIAGKKIFHLFDSFEGLPKPSKKDELKNDIFSLGKIEEYQGTMACPETMVKSNLEVISFDENRYKIHKGFIEKIIHIDENLPEKVSFAYLDFDFYEPIKIVLDFLDNVTGKGSVIIVDDYDFFSTGVKKAVDEFINKKNADGKIYEIFIPDKLFGYFAVITRVT